MSDESNNSGQQVKRDIGEGKSRKVHELLAFLVGGIRGMGTEEINSEQSSETITCQRSIL
jgi:hypothetical protein